LEKIVKKACGSDPKCPLRYVEQYKFNTTQQLFQFYKNVVYDRLGQGIVMTKPESFYAPGGRRTGDRVKLKRREDTEGTVVGYNDDGARLSSLLVKMDNGVVFNLGIGFSNDERIRYKQLFPIGTLIKFSYRELTDGGKPKQARFVQHRLDL
jgi:DNA ligase-1